MRKITSFCVDHDKLLKGMYISRVDGDVITYDLRMVTPNQPPYLDQKGLHTFEHLFATYVRNSMYSDHIIYVGPMGCRTGFYFLTRDSLAKVDAIALIQETMRFISSFEGDIPGAQESKECGAYLEHDLQSAKEMASAYFDVIKDYQASQLDYE